MKTVDDLVRNFDHHDPHLARNFFDVLTRMRTECPVLHSEEHGGYWVLSRYHDVVNVARDDFSFCSRDGILIPGATGDIPIEVDPPEFHRYRRFLNTLFSPPVVARMESFMHQLADDLIDRFCLDGEADFHRDFALPFPAIVTLTMLGFPAEQWEELTTFDVDPSNYNDTHPEGSGERVEPHAPIYDMALDLIAERRRQPQGDVISALVNAVPDGDPFTDDELYRMMRILINGGLLTTTDAIGNALHLMSRSPDIREKLMQDESKLETAVEEFLRIEAPVVGLARTVTRTVDVAGQSMKEGDKILLMWASANRDEAMFTRADEFVLDRESNRHVSFGVGIHRCLGSHLARLEIRIALQHILRRVPDYSINESEIEWPDDVGSVYGKKALPAVFMPRSPISAKQDL